MTPNQPAVTYEKRVLSYSELNEKANQLAHYLINEHQVGPENLVGVFLERGIDFIACLLAIFKAGAAYMPLDPAAPVERTLNIINNGKPTVILSEKKYAFNISDIESSSLVLLDQISDVVESCPKSNPLIVNTNKSLAYVIFTSGSTGEPKGVMLDQMGMINHLFCKIDDLELSSIDTVAQTATQMFDISIWQFLVALVKGGRICILSDDNAWDPSALINTVLQENISILEIVPSYASALIDLLEKEKISSLPLKYLVVTGEALLSPICNRWLKLFPKIPLINAYGPTECSDDVTHNKILTPDHCLKASASIGSGVNNTQTYVLDQALEVLPTGVVGDLYIAGDGVGRGYLNLPELTATKFIANPFVTVEKAIQGNNLRLYKTGDLARWLSDGTLEFLGRNDFQVKVRGYRIELGEIESALLNYPGVQQSVVWPKGVRKAVLRKSSLLATMQPRKK